MDNEIVEISVEELRNLKNNSDYEVFDEALGRWVNISDSSYIDEKATGFAGPKNPYAEINAVTIFKSWTSEYITYAIPPVNKETGKRWDKGVNEIYEVINKLISEGQLRPNKIPKIVLCDSEEILLKRMLDDLQNTDVMSGWNSEFYDFPYIVERLRMLGGDRLVSRLDYLGCRLPKLQMVDRFGSEEPIYAMSGKSHIDYMALFKKFTFEGRVSYSLGNILDEEVGMGKLEYNGTLEELYHNDFPLFVAYNFRDVEGLVQLDEKLKLMALANQMAHESTVLLPATLGTVSYVETAITNHAHYVSKLIVNDKNIKQNLKVEGAIVLTPWRGLHKWLGSVDINSLYPNTIRAINISPEKIVGNFLNPNPKSFIDSNGCEELADENNGEEAWFDIFSGTNDSKVHTFRFESGDEITQTVAEWRSLLKDNKWSISGYGTVFDQSSGNGIVADILGFWYNERLRLQAEKKKYGKLKDSEQDPIKKAEYERLYDHYDLLQLTKKISMNSLYGALLNAAFRFGDARMGASVTGSGRQITTHMIDTIEELLTGERKKFFKVRGKVKKAGVDEAEHDAWHYVTSRKQLEYLRENKKLHNPKVQVPDDFVDYKTCIYGDTDSNYFLTLTDNKADAVAVADAVAAATNDSFPHFVRTAFNCQEGFDKFIKAGREIVGERGLFQAKKKYMIKVVDDEGKAVNKLKTQGSEIKKADTPKIIQKFLKATVDKILNGVEYENVCLFVNDQRSVVLRQLDNMFLLGVAKQVNNLDKYYPEFINPGSQKAIDKNGKMRNMTIPGHARAAFNYNELIKIYEIGAKEIVSGDKVLVFYLKPNDYNFASIAFPAELTKFPKWFNEQFKVDRKKTEDKMFDSKLEGIFDCMGLDIPTPQNTLINSILEF